MLPKILLKTASAYILCYVRTFKNKNLKFIFFHPRYEAIRMAFTQELERRNLMVQLQPGYNTNVQYNATAAVHLVAAAEPVAEVQPQMVGQALTPITHAQPRYPSNYYQGATISEIDDSVASSETTMLNYTTGSVQHGLHPQAVQASPVLVLHGLSNPGHHDSNAASAAASSHQHRHKLRQKALIDSVESKV